MNWLSGNYAVGTNLLCRWSSPRRSYIEDILAHKWHWREDGIINAQPFRQLTKPLLNFGKRFYFVLGVLQLAFMTTFAKIYTPDWTRCTSGRCDLNATSSWRTGSALYSSWLWLIWPSVVLLYNGFMYLVSVLSLRSQLCHRRRYLAPAQRGKVLTTLLLASIERLPPCGFPVALFIWFYAHRNWEGDPHYYQVTSVVFLLGWITTFMFFSCVSKHTYIFSVVLKDIIVKDIINSFMFLFIFTLIAFSSALYVLRGPVDNITVRDTHEINAYEVFASGLTMSEYIEYTIDEHGRHQFFRSVTR